MNIHEDTNTGEGVVTLDEYELHDVVADMLQNMFAPYLKNPDDLIPLQVVIEPKEPDHFTPELKWKWEGGMRALLELVAGMDATYHDDAEYTC